jgi:hypothetical protein
MHCDVTSAEEERRDGHTAAKDVDVSLRSQQVRGHFTGMLCLIRLSSETTQEDSDKQLKHHVSTTLWAGGRRGPQNMFTYSRSDSPCHLVVTVPG